jgi:hypothetical protein
MLQFKSANGSGASRRWAKSGKAKNISKREEFESGIAPPVGRRSASSVTRAQKTVLDEGRLSHGSVYRRGQTSSKGNWLQTGTSRSRAISTGFANCAGRTFQRRLVTHRFLRRGNFFNALHALGADDVPFDFGTCGGYCPRTDAFFHPRHLDFDPRLGIAWAHGDTVLRAGAGIYHTDGQEDDQNLPISNTVDHYSFSNTSFPTLSFPVTPFLQFAEAGGMGVFSPRDLDRNRKDDYVAAWTASVQRKLPWNIIGTASYLGNKGTHVLTTTYTNLVNPQTGVAPYPAFGPVSWRGDVGNSTFQALQLNARRAFQNGFLFSANYMWSHSINDGSIGGGESDTPQDSFCRSCDKASSDDDVRQVFNLSTVYELPFGPGKRYLRTPGPVRTAFGGWSLSAIGTSQTGLPFNITVDRSNGSVPGNYAISGEERPNYVYGVPLTPPSGSTPEEWVNPAAFSTPAAGTFGNLGRNAFRAKRISALDLALAKGVSFAERVRMRFRADAFNVFNRAQYGAPNDDLSQVTFGTITTTISNYATGRGTPREFQLSAKIWF